MKAFRALGIFTLAILVFSSCSKFKEKRFSTTIPYEFEVEITDSDTTFINLEGSLTSMVNKELEKVKDKIKRYELVSVTYKIWEFYGATPNTFTGTIGFGNANAIEAGVKHSITGIDLEINANDPDQVKLNLNSQDISSIQQYFMDTNGLRMFFTGDVDQKPVHFVIELVVNIDAIAEVKK